MWLLWLACAVKDDTAPTSGTAGPTDADTDADSDTDSDTDTDTDTDTEPADLVCAVQEGNVLRVDCTVEVDPPGPVTLTVGDRAFTSDAVADRHTITLWGLRADTTYEVTGPAGAVDVHTGVLPVFLDVDVTTTGGPPVVEGLLYAPSCTSTATVIGAVTTASAAILDPEGEPVWYETYDDWGGYVAALEWTEDGTVLASVGRESVVETTPQGAVVGAWRLADLGLAGLPHHDVTKKDGLWYVLYAVEADGWVIDGIYVIEPESGALVGDLDSRAWFDLDAVVLDGGTDGDGYWSFAFPGSEDATHTNSLFVADDGTLIVSFKDRDAIVGVDGDPDSPTFGDLLWTLEGGTDPALTGTLALSSTAGEVGFDAQHCVSVGPSGRLTVLDNKQRGTNGTSRGVFVALDLAGRSAEIVREVSLESICPEQSALFELPDGSALTTCSATSVVKEFPPDSDEPGWTLEVACNTMMSRATPVDLP